MLDRLGTGFEALLDVDKDGANYRDILSDPCKCVGKRFRVMSRIVDLFASLEECYSRRDCTVYLEAGHSDVDGDSRYEQELRNKCCSAPVVAIELFNKSRESQGVEVRRADSEQRRQSGSYSGNEPGSGGGGVMHMASAELGELGGQFSLLS
jgi:hypothetical protein